MISVWLFILPCAVSFFIFQLLLKINLLPLDNPNHRSAHETPVKRGAGVVFVLMLLPCFLLFWMGWDSILFALALLSVAVVGMVDDVLELGSVIKALVQLVAAFCLLWMEPFSILPWWLLVLLLLFTVWFINLYNFMDGINGLAALNFLFCAIVLWFFLPAGLWYLQYLVVIAGVVAAFTVFNFPMARLFMGDVGSGLLGILLSTVGLLLVVEGYLPLFSWLLLNTVFLVDTSYTLMVRMGRGEPWWKAHSSHMYQKLNRHLASHQKTTLFLTLVNIVWVFPLFYLSLSGYSFFLWLLCCMPLLLLSRYFKAGVPSTMS